MNKTAIIFSGQGSQSCKMGASFKDNDTYKQTIKDIESVRNDLTYILSTANEEEINDTLNAQIALYANQIAIHETIKSEFDLSNCVYAGFSLGEYTAMAASGVTDIKTMATIVDKRSQAMAKENGNGKMKAIIGMEYVELAKLIIELNQKYKTKVQIANYNQKNQIVLAATSDDFAAIDAELNKHKLRIIELKVSGAFHTDLYRACANSFVEQIGKVEFNTVDNLYSNVTSKIMSDVSRKYLIEHMITGVNWYPEVLEMIANGVDIFVEVNEKSTLLPMIKRINRKVKLIHVGELSDLEKLEEVWNRK